ncbi:LSU ribosomal protein L4P [Archaeoglobus sulfaticallidus PM70-1]|uniref:Large ribosomal subunit protein uL4 n=1 Tax=Archaeoglobus sulfaticallidus PM70-1 TaxID=387631 RepID=N0BAY8_9EURY|nr:50S ribosomal protein L4 [Archaeoglobus sulfaticallidus]AGK60163.1 LSU ribosomal protein L4P [Archaeoglobus sulfaticallidus PM70-1]
MKAKVYDLKGEVVEEIELPSVFDTEYRPDIIRKAIHSLQSRRRQPYGPSPLAGINYSAENWGPGHGYARVPRLKTGSRAVKVPQAVGGRRAHPPKVQKIWEEKINKKEMRKALCSAIAATVNAQLVSERPHIFSGELPKIVVDDLQNLKKTKEVVEALKAIGVYEDVERAKSRKRYRAGKGKMRGRRYIVKKSVLIVAGEKSDILNSARNLAGVDVVVARNLNVELLAPGAKAGRLTVWTKSAIEALEGWLC